MTAESVISEAEAVLGSVTDDLLGVRDRECLLCYVHRMLGRYGCSGMRWASHYRDVRAPRATALERRLGQGGGFCDCEIFLNAYTLEDRFVVPPRKYEEGGVVYETEPSWPKPFPECHGVRAGSTQSCGLWRRRRRGSRYDW